MKFNNFWTGINFGWGIDAFIQAAQGKEGELGWGIAYMALALVFALLEDKKG